MRDVFRLLKRKPKCCAWSYIIIHVIADFLPEWLILSKGYHCLQKGFLRKENRLSLTTSCERLIFVVIFGSRWIQTWQVDVTYRLILEQQVRNDGWTLVIETCVLQILKTKTVSNVVTRPQYASSIYADVKCRLRIEINLVDLARF